jgi:hypothetical protein
MPVWVSLIGLVASAFPHEDEVFAMLRRRATALHADLITDVRFEHGEGEGKPTRLAGKAIRFRARGSSDLQ